MDEESELLRPVDNGEIKECYFCKRKYVHVEQKSKQCDICRKTFCRPCSDRIRDVNSFVCIYCYCD